jgi:subtilisin-like proprotein convertase family protein
MQASSAPPAVFILNAAKLIAFDPSGFRATLNIDRAPLSAQPAPPLYSNVGNGYFAGAPLLTNTRMSMNGYFSSKAGDPLYGWEFWKDNVLVDSLVTPGPYAFKSWDEQVAGPHEIIVAGMSQLGTTSNDRKTLYHRAYATSGLTAIPDVKCTSIPLDVAATGTGPVSEIDLSFSISHAYLQDLDIYLLSPGGKSARAVARVGGSGQDFLNTRIFSNGGSGPGQIPGIPSINQGQAPFSGVFTPSGDLSALHGESVSGRWQFQVCDRAASHSGQVQWIRLFLLAAAAPK